MSLHLRLTNQQLSGALCATPQNVVAYLGAMQAQDFNMAKWAVGIRLPGSTNSNIEDAFNNGEILRTHVLRPTWHFVAPHDICWMLALSAPRIRQSTASRDRDLEITEALYTKCNRIIEKALEKNEALTRDELAAIMERSGVTMDTPRATHFMMRAELEGIVCSGPLQGKKHTYALLSNRTPKTKSLGKDEALARLADRYFRSHGPAAIQDFVWWSGLTVGEASQGLEAVKKKLVSEKIGTQEYWHYNDSPKSAPNNKSLLLLPAFDEYIIAYRDRSAMLAAAHHSKAISSNGIFRPTIVHNGQVIGLWKKTASKNNPVTLDYFGRVDKAVKAAADEAVEQYRKFLTAI